MEVELQVKSVNKNPSSQEVPVFFEEIKQEAQIKINKKNAKKLRKKEKKSGKKGKSQEPVTALDEHTLSIQEVAQRYNTDVDLKEPKSSKGLSTAEAKRKLQEYGPNMLSQAQVTPMWLKFLKEFIGFFPLLLEGAGILCFIGYGLQTENKDNLYLGIILWVVVIVTAIFSFMQESKSSKVMEGFKKLAPQYCKVHRDGKVTETNASELVVGDVVHVKAGDKIPADLLLFWVNELKVDNSSLTGESEPQSRTTECTDQNFLETHNLAFFGTLANEGEGLGIVVRTGDRTVIGTIANLASSTKSDNTPLKTEISRFIKIVSVVAISLGIIFFIVGYFVKLDWIPNVVFAIGIIVANVPEGLLPTVTVALTLTAKRLASKNVLVKNLQAVETLGSCSTIASDKTGTLTQNRMTVVHVWYDEKIYTCDTIVNAGVFDPSSLSFTALHRIAALCNNAVFDSNAENMEKEVLLRKVVGDASESALLKFCEPLGNVEQFRARYPKVFEIPFNSVNKWQLSIHQTPDHESILLLKGAPERVITRCSKIMIEGEETEMTTEHQKKFQEAYETLASNGERVLGFAQLPLNSKDFPPGYIYDVDKANFPTEDLVFVGLVALMDPPRTTVPDAVAKCKQAGVRVIMVTGDHPLTAVAIARQVGIIEGKTVDDIAKMQGIPVSEVNPEDADAVVVKGSDISELQHEDWDKILSKRQIVFARTSPEQKLQIVEQCQKRGEIVAVTGDGVNDSPALKKADLGCAMGITGSDVSKEAADVILLDDNFASIVAGIEEGRIIFDNLKKSICYTLSSNTTELLPFLLFVIARMPLALSAVLILCVDLGTDMIPAISLAYERPESDIMTRKPRNTKKDRLVTPVLAAFSYIYLSIWQTIAGFVAYLTVFSDHGIAPSEVTGISFDYFKKGAADFMGYTAAEQLKILAEAQTAFFVAVVLTRIGCLLVCKTKKLSVIPNLFKNRVTNIGIFIEVILMVVLVYVPGVTTVFGTTGVGWKPWVIGIPFSLGLFAFEEVRKIWIRKYPHGWIKRISYW